MSAVRTVLLLWVCVGAIVSTYGALVISTDTDVQVSTYTYTDISHYVHNLPCVSLAE